MERRLSELARAAAAVLALAGSCLVLACNATGPEGPREEALTIRSLSSGPFVIGSTGVGPDIGLIQEKLVLRASYVYPSSGWLLSGVLVRRGPDTLVVEIRARLADYPGLDLIWRHDYEATSPGTTRGAYRLSWWHVNQTLNTRTLVLDTSIVIPPSP